MKTKLSLFIFALLAISIYSCKKEDKNSPVEASALFFAVDSLIGKIDLKNSNAISDFAKGSSSGFTHETVYGMALIQIQVSFIVACNILTVLFIKLAQLVLQH
jgi:hypothetical protein